MGLLEPAILRSPATHRRRVIFGTAVGSAALTALAWACALFLSPCEPHAAPDCSEGDFVAGLIRLLEEAKGTGTALSFLYLYFRTTLRALRLVRLREPDAVGPGSVVVRTGVQGATATGTELTSHWTAAASSDIFLQVSRMIRTMRILVAPFNAIVFLSTLIGVVSAWATGTPFTRLESGFSCGDGDGAASLLCISAWEGHLLAFGLCIPLLVYLLSVLVLLPDALWSPTTLVAIKQTNEWRMARMRWLPVMLPFPICVGIMTIIIYGLAGRKFNYPGPVYAVFFTNTVAVVYQLCVIAWLFLPWGAPTPSVDADPLVRTAVSQLSSTTAEGAAANPCSPWIQPWAQRFRRLLRSRESGARVAREAVLLLLASSLSQREMFSTYDRVPALMLVRWALRLGALVFIVAVKDEAADFDTLAETGAAFGLVADIHDLRKAVTHTLKLRKPSPSTVRTYKASLMRMRETLSVSYRWQAEDRPIAKGVQLNMSDWQLRSLLDAITDTNCRYVWLDRISVIQATGDLQHTLLSRMMAVYASSACTLVLRSREHPGNRYHQRGWTVQEFCSCSKACVVSEPISLSSVIDIRKSRLKLAVMRTSAFHTGDQLEAGDGSVDEERYFESLRAWHHRRVLYCMPFWLQRGGGCVVRDDAIETAVLKFMDLASRVNTEEPKDLVRALVPMLANCPMETEAELVALLELMNAKADSPGMLAYLQLFRPRNHKAIRPAAVGSATASGWQAVAGLPQALPTTVRIAVEPQPACVDEDDIEANLLRAAGA